MTFCSRGNGEEGGVKKRGEVVASPSEGKRESLSKQKEEENEDRGTKEEKEEGEEKIEGERKQKKVHCR